MWYWLCEENSIISQGTISLKRVIRYSINVYKGVGYQNVQDLNQQKYVYYAPQLLFDGYITAAYSLYSLLKKLN